MTPAEIRAQAESFAVAEMGFGSDSDEQAYAIAVLSGDKAEMAPLDKQAQQCMDQARTYFQRMRP